MVIALRRGLRLAQPSEDGVVAAEFPSPIMPSFWLQVLHAIIFRPSSPPRRRLPALVEELVETPGMEYSPSPPTPTSGRSGHCLDPAGV